MDAALMWGKDPDTWYQTSRAARAMMIATCAMKARVESVVLNNGNK